MASYQSGNIKLSPLVQKNRGAPGKYEYRRAVLPAKHTNTIEGIQLGFRHHLESSRGAGDAESHAGAVAHVRVETLAQQRHDAGHLLGRAVQ